MKATIDLPSTSMQSRQMLGKTYVDIYSTDARAFIDIIYNRHLSEPEIVLRTGELLYKEIFEVIQCR